MERIPLWLRPEGLEPLWRLNEQALELFVDIARLPDGGQASVSLTPPLREAFRRVDAATRRRLVRIPTDRDRRFRGIVTGDSELA